MMDATPGAPASVRRGSAHSVSTMMGAAGAVLSANTGRLWLNRVRRGFGAAAAAALRMNALDLTRGRYQVHAPGDKFPAAAKFFSATFSEVVAHEIPASSRGRRPPRGCDGLADS